MKNLKLFVPIAKVDVEKREVWGQAVAEVVDKSKEIFDYASSVPLFREWSAEFEKVTDGKSLGNIRAMHGKVAAGKVISFTPDDAEKRIDIGTKIVDDQEWQKCLDGVYTGFSIGGSYVKRWKDETDSTVTRYTAAPSEISLVDNPCVPTATFAMVKADGSSEDKSFQRYGVLKALIADEKLSNGDLFKLAASYLPPSQLEELAKADVTMGEVRTALVKLSEAEPEPEPEKVAPVPAPEAAPVATPPAAVKTLKVLGLKKGMYSISDLANCLCTIAYLASDAQWEAEYEKDGSGIPEELRAWLAAGIAIFKKMSIEEADELLASIMPAGADKAAAAPLTKAEITATIQELLGKTTDAGDHAEPLAKFLAVDSLGKIAALEKANAQLTADLEKVTGQRDEIAKDAAALLETRKGALRAVAKGADQADLVKTDDPKAPPTDAQAEFKKAFQRPVLMSGRTTP